jgi:hypothetical protein
MKRIKRIRKKLFFALLTLKLWLIEESNLMRNCKPDEGIRKAMENQRNTYGKTQVRGNNPQPLTILGPFVNDELPG